MSGLSHLRTRVLRVSETIKNEPLSFYHRFPQAFSNNTLWARGAAASKFAFASRPIGSDHHNVCHAAGTDLAERHLSLSEGVQILWWSYRNVTAPVSAETSGWLPAYHGTWFYGLWSILHHGIFLESTNEGRGRIGCWWFGRWSKVPMLGSPSWQLESQWVAHLSQEQIQPNETLVCGLDIV